MKLTPEKFLIDLQAHAATFAKAVATNEGEWIIKGFIDVYERITQFRWIPKSYRKF